jgi:hypothetical protein
VDKIFGNDSSASYIEKIGDFPNARLKIARTISAIHPMKAIFGSGVPRQRQLLL